MARAKKAGNGKADGAAKAPAKPRRTARTAKREEAARGALEATATRLDRGALPPELAKLAEAVDADGGAVLCAYAEPLAGRPLLLAALPIDRVDPTPYQRPVSAPHVEKLADAIVKTGVYLDPIIAFRDAPTGRYHTPNGGHRLEALRKIGARAITALVVPDERIAFRILALNTEKAHNLRERAQEVSKMARSLAPLGGRESEMAPYFEEAALLTLGLAYEKRPRLSGAVYHPIVRRIDRFLDEPLAETLPMRERRADSLLALDDAVAAAVEALKARGIQSPYLKNFVVARINPLRFSRKKADDAPPPDFDATVEKLRAAAERFDPSRIEEKDLAGSGGATDDAE